MAGHVHLPKNARSGSANKVVLLGTTDAGRVEDVLAADVGGGRHGAFEDARVDLGGAGGQYDVEMRAYSTWALATAARTARIASFIVGSE
jgi:hypothetical protein